MFSGSNPCETSTACGTLKTALELSNSSTTASNSDELGYCDAGGGSVTGEYYQPCLNCLSASGDANYLANCMYCTSLGQRRGWGRVPWQQDIDSRVLALVALEAGCLQRPNTTDLLGLSGSIFSSSVIEIVDPSASSASTTSSTQLSTAAIAGIAAGGTAIIAIIAGVVFIRYRRRRNRSGIGGKPRWDKSRKRRSSFSFKCRNILASPLSPKFFRDLTPVEEHHEPYGSLDAQMSGVAMGGQGDAGRYYIETKPKLERHPYETSLDGWRAQDVVPDQTSALVPDRWNTYAAAPKKKKVASRKGPITIDTTEAALARPPAAHQSPRANQFGISPSASSSYIPAEHHGTPITTTSPSQTPGRTPVKPKTTTMSSQGSGYPSLHGQGSSSPLLRQQQQQQQHGWRGARENQEPWFPPPPSVGPPPSSSSSSLKFGGRKVSAGSVRRGKRESGSPVESKTIQVSFPAPPQR